jgi:hypothetical protein
MPSITWLMLAAQRIVAGYSNWAYVCQPIVDFFALSYDNSGSLFDLALAAMQGFI